MTIEGGVGTAGWDQDGTAATSPWGGRWTRRVKALALSAAMAAAACGGGTSGKEVELASKLQECKRAQRTLEDDLALAKQKLAEAIENPEAMKLDPEVLHLVADLPKTGTKRPTSTGRSLDQRAIVPVVQANRGALQACWERALKRNNNLQYASPRLTLAFNVQPNGAVGGVSIAPNHDSAMDSCFKQAIARWKFPAFDGEPVRIEAPVTLEAKK
jgi:hypothetical protein